MRSVFRRVTALFGAVVILLGVVPIAASAATVETVLFYEGFEGSSALPAGWTAYDVDGDGYNWRINSGGTNGYLGGNCLESCSAMNGASRLTPDEYVVLPPLAIPASVESSYELSFQIRTSYMSGYSDYITVYVSTAPVVDPTALTDDQIVLNKRYYSGSTYQEMTADLDAYRGQTVYVVFHHHTASGIWQQIDDVMITSHGAARFPVKFDLDEDIMTVIPENGTFEAIDGQNYAFTLEFAEKYNPLLGKVEVTANGEVVTPKRGVYTLKNVTEKQKVSVTLRYKAGDISANGKVDLADAARLFYYLNEQIDFDSVQMAAADIDTYATVDIRDMTALFYYVAGLRDYLNKKDDIEGLWNTAYTDAVNGFGQVGSVKSAEYYLDRRLVLDQTASAQQRDSKVIFKNSSKSRVVNLSDGYVFTLPYTDFKADYSLSAYRSTYENANAVLNVSKETSNPYGANQWSWDTYSYEWLTQCLTDDNFLRQNNLSRTHDKVEGNTAMLSGYHVWRYDIVINDAQDIEMPYYSIAVIRKDGEYVKFHLFVMKSTTDRAATMDAMVKSFKEITPVGISQNEQVAYECAPDENWNEETAAYYHKLVTQSTTDWGIFTESMSDTNNSADNLRKEYAELSEKLNFTYDIMPTYSHIAWGNTMHYFPSKTAAEFAGGNGFNGKPVLQFTYQFTINNNLNVKASKTPMFDIARGKYDEHFRRLARDIKAYGAPVLFRLNNEMNTDWTSYCGMVTLLDPDFFAMTWERLYDIFEQEGVGNCIWIFNPVATTTPYCSWGEDLCYLPDLDTVHALGLTAYEMGNGQSLQSFETLYRELYEKNSPYFDRYPQIISEFAAGAGGEKQYNYGSKTYEDTILGRNASLQAKWVGDMFACLAKRNEKGYEFCQAIKGAVWFCVNDYATIENKDYIINNLEIHDASIEAFRNGLALHP